jgi:hypothetical protein
MKKLIFLCRSWLAAAALVAPPAHAALMTETVSGQPVTVDTSTGLAWLDASKTLGLSPNTALADFPGFQFASESQVITLLKDAGMPAADLPNGSTASTAPGDLLAATLGYSLSPWVPYFGSAAATWEYESWGWFLDSSGTSADEFFIDVRNPPLGAEGTYTMAYLLHDSPVVASSNNFDFLVMQAKSEAPEPASVAILGAALASLGAWRATLRVGRKRQPDAV